MKKSVEEEIMILNTIISQMMEENNAFIENASRDLVQVERIQENAILDEEVSRDMKKRDLKKFMHLEMS